LLGRDDWLAPVEFGPDGWSFTHARSEGSVIVSVADFNGADWVHASIARTGQMPTYDDLCKLHRAVFGTGYAYQVFAPPADHINIHEYALHLWGRADGAAALPNFGVSGSI
jgi:hypothetical protein